MTKSRCGRVAAYGLFLTVSASSASMAWAQSAPPTVNAPPIRSPVDQNGVNLATGGIEMSTTDLSIGAPGAGGLAHSRVWTGNGWRHGFFLTVTTTSTTAMVSIGGQSATFTLSGGVYTADQANGSSLTSTSSTFTYTAADGTVIIFDRSYSGDIYYGQTAALGTSITLPSGEKVTLTYKPVTYTIPGTGSITIARLQSVNSSSGYQLKYSYGSDIFTISQVTGINNGFDYCDPMADSCTSLTNTWPSVSYSTATVGSDKQESVTDALNHVTRFTTDSSGRMKGIKRPSSSSDNVTIAYDANGRISSVTRDFATWTYGWSLSGSTLTATVTDPLMHQRVTTADTGMVVLKTDKDALNRTTNYLYDSPSGRLTYVVPPEGIISSMGVPTAGYVKYDYDGRGNLMTTTAVSKTPGTPPDIVTSASYPSTCTSQLTCNKPTSTVDARGKVTTYLYDTTTGFVTSVKSTAIGGVQPETRFSYSGVGGNTNLYAYYMQASLSSPTQATTQIHKLITVSRCATTSSCGGGADEIKSTIGYGSQTTGTANNLLPVSVTSGSGDGTLAATATTAYDMAGNLYTVDGPLSGTGDTTRYRFDAVHELVGIVSPDPDGAGPLKNRALRYTYDPDGKPTLIEQGTVDSQSDPDWSTFVTLWKEGLSYDVYNRLFEVSTPGSTLSQKRVTQYDYDGANRLICAVNRMKFYNPLDPVPASPCLHYTPGTYGEDRLTTYGYDAADQLTTVTTAVFTPQERINQTFTYTNNGKLQTVKDAKNNLTTVEYDGFDRPLKLRYPSPSTPNSSSTTDYEQFTYDAGSNITVSRRRDGSTISLTYDDLSRVTAKDLPGSEPDVAYGYDNLGRTTSTSSSVASLSFVYDQLGRMTRQVSPQGNTDYQYDLAGRRTRMTWPDAFYVTYDYLLTNEMTAVRENGASSGVGVLATFGYDDLGRRTTLTRGNGAVTTYGYDAGSRLTGLTQDLASTGSDQTQALSYNPAFQITQQTRSNDTYAFTQSYNANRNYTANGLNQYTAAGNATPAYDSKGNLTSFWSNSYSYSSENLLTAANGTSEAYDPALRLYQISGATGTRFGYDGSNMVGEYNTSNALQRRYVFGPGSDEPLVWYEGSGTTDRRWLHADERGSVTAVSDGSGNPIAIDSYDEYGTPSTSNIGRFQYTGQMWLSELGSGPNALYHFKARTYSPRLGRFLQTDPIGLAGGMNLYNYAGSDPVNNRDPSGNGIEELFPNYDFSDAGLGDIVVPGYPTPDFGPSPFGLPNYVPDLPYGLGGGDGGVAQPPSPDQPAERPILVKGYQDRNRFTGAAIQLGSVIYGVGDQVASIGLSDAGQDDDIVVTANRHRYVLRYLNPCSASSVFGYFKQAGHSAPGAPAAREGFTGRLVLTGGNPISQFVNSSTGTIINTTLPGHRYFPGTVTIQVTPLSSETSATAITGEGTGAHSEENVILGEAFFGSQAAGAQTACGI